MVINSLIDVIGLSQKQCTRPIQANLVYATRDNFVGQVVDGYTPGVDDFALMTKDAAQALCEVQNALLKNHNLGLLIYDSYRPKRAVKHFMRWSTAPVLDEHELKRKAIHYPRIEKNKMFELGYVAEDSQHCYGHTVDLVLIDENNQELTLGACFDYMDTLSHNTVTSADIGEEAWNNRQILAETMENFGFIPYFKEFWHFSFKNKMVMEPIDLIIDSSMKNLNIV